MRAAIDTGGTFTDLVIQDGGGLELHKAPTTQGDPAAGILAAFELAAHARGQQLDEILAECELLQHGTTHPLNAVLTGRTARTGLVITAGHPDVLVFREGARRDPFDLSVRYPDPYVPRALTVEVPERIDAEGRVRLPLDEAATRASLARLRDADVEAVAVCLLWSVVARAHEARVGELIEEVLPGVPYTLSHQLNPTLREYRRASSAAIDASLKPLMTRYLEALSRRLEEAGFRGRLLICTSSGGVKPAAEVAAAPIHALGSGPAMAPIAGRHFAEQTAPGLDAIVADTGGTSFDVSIVRKGRIPRTRETWIGTWPDHHMTGFAAVDVRSVGSGGGSIARVDRHGLLSVGPLSAGAVPGPAAYGAGGEFPTFTDAAVVLGIIDPGNFLGGRMRLDAALASTAVRRHVAEPLGVGLEQAAAAVLELGTENMVGAVRAITVDQGIDPVGSAYVAGGGAGGLNATQVARRLGCPVAIVPQVGPVLSAAGALMSELVEERARVLPGDTRALDLSACNFALDELESDLRGWAAKWAPAAERLSIYYAVEARYPGQSWEIEVRLPVDRLKTDEDVRLLERAFHDEHFALYAFRDEGSPVQVLQWKARIAVKLAGPDRDGPQFEAGGSTWSESSRPVFFSGHGWLDTTILDADAMAVAAPDAWFDGPAVVETRATSVLIDPGARAHLDRAGTLVIEPRAHEAAGARGTQEKANRT